MSTVVVGTIRSNSTSPPTIQNTSGTEIGTFCRAWVNFNGTTVTNPASMTGVRASFNVSSILDNGTGNYTVNFTNAMPDANYASQYTAGDVSNAAVMGGLQSNTANSATILTVSRVDSTGLIDVAFVSVAIFR